MERANRERILINSAEEFLRLRTSTFREEYLLAAEDEAPMTVWLDVIFRFPEMKEWVAHNKTIPIEILEMLASDGSASVRATVADKRKLTPELFGLLAKDVDELVRQRVAYNRKVPVQILQSLLTDASPLVRDAARKRLGQAAL
jgi:hypothetical protein